MKLLAIETATLSCSVALLINNKVVCEITTQDSRNHSVTLLPNIIKLLDEAGYTLQQLTAVAIGIGPGSFTGLRIGLATAKALAYAAELPLVGVPTMRTLFLQHKYRADYVVPLLDAQQGNLYTAVYGIDGECSVIAVKPATKLPEVVKAAGTFCFCGELKADLRAALGTLPRVILPPPHECLPNARYTALAAKQMYLRGMISDINGIEPIYIRKSAAEEKLLERLKND